MISPSVSLGFLLCSRILCPVIEITGKKTGVLTPEKRAHPPGGHAVFTSSRDHIALRAKSYKESSRVCTYILKEIFSSENFAKTG
jgi:hypothetical protein